VNENKLAKNCPIRILIIFLADLGCIFFRAGRC
jgi:hypothetical protein